MGKSSSTKGMLTGILIGSAVGSAIALLYAPKSGKELRGDIKEKSDEYLTAAKDNFSSLYNTAKERGEALLAETNTLLESAVNSTGAFVNGSKDGIIGELHKLKTSIQAMLETYSTIGTDNMVKEVTEHHIPRKLKKKLKGTKDPDEKQHMAEEILDKLND